MEVRLLGFPAYWQLSIVAVLLPHLVNDDSHTSKSRSRVSRAPVTGIDKMAAGSDIKLNGININYPVMSPGWQFNLTIQSPYNRWQFIYTLQINNPTLANITHIHSAYCSGINILSPWVMMVLIPQWSTAFYRESLSAGFYLADILKLFFLNGISNFVYSFSRIAAKGPNNN